MIVPPEDSALPLSFKGKAEPILKDPENTAEGSPVKMCAWQCGLSADRMKTGENIRQFIVEACGACREDAAGEESALVNGGKGKLEQHCRLSLFIVSLLQPSSRRESPENSDSERRTVIKF